MSGAKHKQKGSRVERELVKRHQAIGVAAERMPLSGAAGGNFTGDILVTITSDGLPSWTLRGEVKARKNGEGFAVLEGWLGSNDLLLLRRNNAQPLVVLPWATWERLLVRAQDEKPAESK